MFPNKRENTMAWLGSFAILILLLSIAFFTSGCVIKKEVTPQSQMIMMYDLYNFQFVNYMHQTGYTKVEGIWKKTFDPVLSEDQKEILRNKKKMLSEIYPLIQIYNSILMHGDTIPPDLQERILLLLDSLATKVQ